jgi:hypothetical protein
MEEMRRRLAVVEPAAGGTTGVIAEDGPTVAVVAAVAVRRLDSYAW